MTKICAICKVKFNYEFKEETTEEVICNYCYDDIKKLYERAITAMIMRENEKKKNDKN